MINQGLDQPTRDIRFLGAPGNNKNRVIYFKILVILFDIKFASSSQSFASFPHHLCDYLKSIQLLQILAGDDFFMNFKI